MDTGAGALGNLRQAVAGILYPMIPEQRFPSNRASQDAKTRRRGHPIILESVAGARRQRRYVIMVVNVNADGEVCTCLKCQSVYMLCR